MVSPALLFSRRSEEEADFDFFSADYLLKFILIGSWKPLRRQRWRQKRAGELGALEEGRARWRGVENGGKR